MAAVAAAGCGTPSADLLRVQRSGSGPGAALDLVVSDAGTVRCNRGRPRPIGARRLLAARGLARAVAPQARLGLELAPGPRERTALRYRAELAEGSVAWADSSARVPPELVALAALARRLARDACGLVR